MNIQHKELAAGRWQEMPLMEQLANVGSEVERTLNWRAKNKPDMSGRAFDRSLELIDFTLNDPKNRSRLSEICRMRECWCDFIAGDNVYKSTPESWRKYFLEFNYAARKNK